LDPYLDLLDITMVIDSLNQHPVWETTVSWTAGYIIS
jgi:hypothetical protein